MKIKDYKKRYAICKDSLGKMIYWYDLVEVWNPTETRTPHQSRVYWNMLDGAFIDEHPSHAKLHKKVCHRSLNEYLRQEKVPLWDHNDDKLIGYQIGYVKKIKSFYNE